MGLGREHASESRARPVVSLLLQQRLEHVLQRGDGCNVEGIVDVLPLDKAGIGHERERLQEQGFDVEKLLQLRVLLVVDCGDGCEALQHSLPFTMHLVPAQKVCALHIT